MVTKSALQLSQTPLFSVVICTRNRAELLSGALESLANQDLKSSEFEILIVDNNASDETASTAKSFCRHQKNARYCFESKEGLSHARNLGWQVAQGEYVAYMDDDCRASSTWLMIGKEIVETIAPDVFGGPYMALFLSPRPPWFRYGSHIPWEEAHFLERNEYGGLTGGNIFLLRSLLQRLRGFDSKLGMMGRRLAYGEETELLKRVSMLEPTPRLYYDPRLVVHHIVSPEKMSISWIICQRFIGGRYSLLAIKSKTDVSSAKLFVMILCRISRLVIELLKGAIIRDKTRYPYYQNYFCEEAFDHIRYVGQFYEQLVQLLREKQRSKR